MVSDFFRVEGLGLGQIFCSLNQSAMGYELYRKDLPPN